MNNETKETTSNDTNMGSFTGTTVTDCNEMRKFLCILKPTKDTPIYTNFDCSVGTCPSLPFTIYRNDEGEIFVYNQYSELAKYDVPKERIVIIKETFDEIPKIASSCTFKVSLSRGTMTNILLPSPINPCDIKDVLVNGRSRNSLKGYSFYDVRDNATGEIIGYNVAYELFGRMYFDIIVEIEIKYYEEF